MDRITQTWVHCSKFTGRSIRARNLEDTFVHAQQQLLNENAILRKSLDELTKHQTQQSQHTAGPTPAAPQPPQPAATLRQQSSLSPPFYPQPEPQPQPQLNEHQAAVQQPRASAASHALLQQVSLGVQERWEGPVTELVTYELELDTGQQQVTSSPNHQYLSSWSPLHKQCSCPTWAKMLL